MKKEIGSIARWPDVCLRCKANEVLEVTDRERLLYRELVVAMQRSDGLGIAAPQIGESVRMFVVVGSLANKRQPMAFINPKIVWKSDDGLLLDEGCLSFPGVLVSVWRPLRVVVNALGINGEPFRADIESPLLARCLLHEYDHLEGKLLIDNVTDPAERRRVEECLRRR